VNAKPIEFKVAAVRALIDGRRTQARRFMRPQPDEDGRVTYSRLTGAAYVRGSRGGQCLRVPCPYGKAGDLLWVREAFDMPREASRLTLRISDVRVERVQVIRRDLDGDWDAGRWVWELTFDVIHDNVDSVLAEECGA
jgi:hypothetical protein